MLEKIIEPRYPSFKGINGGESKKPVQTLSAGSTLGVPRRQRGLGRVADRGHLTSRPGRRARPKVIVKDGEDGGVKAAAFLAERKFI